MTCSTSPGPGVCSLCRIGDTAARETHRRIYMQLLVIVGLVMLLSACSGLSRSDRPAQVEEHGTAVPQTEAAPGSGEEAQIAAYTPPAQPVIVRPEPNRAVTVLTQRADKQRRSGDLDGATVSLERALRIAPDDADLWHKLAGVRMAQSRHDLVVQLAKKSNTLANPADVGLRSSNWGLIAKAQRAMGDTGGAREAQRHADSLN